MEFVDDMVAILTEMFPEEPEEVILDAILTRGSVEDASDAIVEYRRLRSLEERTDETTFKELCSLFPRVEKHAIASICVAFPESPVEELIDTIIAQLTTRRKARYCKIKLEEASSSEPPRIEQLTFSSAVMCQDRGLVARGEEDRRNSQDGISFSYDFGLASDTPDEAPAVFRERARELAGKKRDYLERAFAAHQRGGLTGRGYAAYLASEARRLDGEIEWNSAMAAAIVFKRNNPSIERCRKIDLHGLTVREVEPLVHAFLRHHFTIVNSPYVEIVTGFGRGSLNGVRLRPLVFSILSSLDYRFSFDNFAVFTVFREG